METFVATCFTGSTFFRLRCLLYANDGKIFPRWSDLVRRHDLCALRTMRPRHAVILTLSADGDCPLWSYLQSGTLPWLISFICHSLCKLPGVYAKFPIWNSLLCVRQPHPLLLFLRPTP